MKIIGEPRDRQQLRKRSICESDSCEIEISCEIEARITLSRRQETDRLPPPSGGARDGEASEKISIATDGDVPVLAPPYSLRHRWEPSHLSQCYMLGTVGGKPKTFITNVSVGMAHDFLKIMQQILEEAKEGRFHTKDQAVKRRDELVKESQAAPAEVALLAHSVEPQAGPAESFPTFDPELYPDGQVPEEW